MNGRTSEMLSALSLVAEKLVQAIWKALCALAVVSLHQNLLLFAERRQQMHIYKIPRLETNLHICAYKLLFILEAVPGRRQAR